MSASGAGSRCRGYGRRIARGRGAGPIRWRGLEDRIAAMNALALVTDAFGSSGGIAQYNRDLIAALAEIPGANRIIVLPRLGDGYGTALPSGVRQLKAQGNRLSYSLTALRAAVMLG